MKDLYHRAIALFFRFTFWWIRLVPKFVSYGFATLIALFITPFIIIRDRFAGMKRTSMRRNFRYAFGPDFPESHVRYMTFKVVQHLAWLIIDYARIPLFDRNDLARTVTAEDAKLLQDIYDEGKGVIVATGHVGNFEMNGIHGPMFGHPLKTIVHPLRNKHLNQVLEDIRTCKGQSIIGNRRVLFDVKDTLKKGDFIGILVDENTKRKATWLPFFGTVASVNTTVPNMHRLTGAPIVIVATHRVKPGHYEFVIYDVIRHEFGEDRHEGEKAIMKRILAATEKAIRKYPEQWFWASRRWKRRPEGEVLDENELPPRLLDPVWPNFFKQD
ncbi:MAG: lysophospholipid acyltransferase family protein [Planctomycetota bacterium]|nr:lysophospholipid acyltransferase family protein [Planctomycetota bacterium]